MSLKNKVAIVGADETDQIGIVPNMTPIMMHAQAARNALRDAGIDKSEVDAVFTCGIGGMASVQLCEYLGIVPEVHRQHDDRRVVVRDPRRARGGGDQRRAVQRRADHARRDRATRAGCGAGRAAAGS